MAQVLKESFREAILEAARAEFLEKGFKNASMRSIASRAGMTAGNLYRYYKNKEDLANSISEETLSAFRGLIADLKIENVGKELRVYDTRPQIEEINSMLETLGARIADLYGNDRDRLNMIMSNPKAGRELTLWFHSLISNISSRYDGTSQDRKEVYMLRRSYAVAMHSGLREMIRNHEDDPDMLKRTLTTYLTSFVSLLNGKVDLSRE